MDLIIKPTEACNFACDFCSSTDIADDKKQVLDLVKIENFLNRFPETNTVIVNGGDPTMVPVSYYYEIIKILDERGSKANISVTTNLWKFWLEWQRDNSEKKWTKLFKEKRVNVTTSFQYGEGRKITKNKVFDEEIFVKVSDLFLEKIGYRPSFISVVSEGEEDLAIKNVELAKKLGVDCKLNYANKSGACDSVLPLSKVYEIYIEIWKRGLADHEWNTRQMVNRLYKTNVTMCPLNRDCDSGIRVLQPDGKYYSCGAFGDDGHYPVDFEKEMSGGFEQPLKNDMFLDALKSECYSCEMFQICNGCKKHISDLKSTKRVEEHCTKMKSLAPDILKLNEEKIEIQNDTYYEASGFLEKPGAS